MKFLFFLLLSIAAFAQNDIVYKGENINTVDQDRNKQGIWKLYDDEKQLLITCEFIDGNQITPTNYYKEGELIASFDTDTEIISLYRGVITQAKFVVNEDKSIAIKGLDGGNLETKIAEFYYENLSMQPKYYGGIQNLYNYVNAHYDIKKIKIKKGKLILRFILDFHGLLYTSEIAQGITPEMNAEALKAVKGMARWQPGHYGGRFVRAQYNLPITFK